MKTVLLIITLTLIFSFIVNQVECLTKESDESKTPRESIDIGPFKFQAFYNETNTKDRLRLSKSYFKVKVLDRHSPDNLYVTFKVSRLEELIRCENVTLESQEAPSILDCQPIENFLDATESSSDYAGIGGYVRRSSIRLKEKLPKPLPHVLQDHYLYPLKKKLIEKKINDLVAEHNLTSLDFTNLRVDLGYYFETHIKQHKEDLDPVICSGMAFLSVNRTEILARFSHDPYPEFLDEIFHFYRQGSKNGYLLSLQDQSCTKANFGNYLVLTGSFTLIQRLKFPYLVVRHTIMAEPLTAIFQYTAQVDQKRTPEVGPSAYNTTVGIVSRSGLFSGMNFDLDQVFRNKDSNNSEERMTLVSSSWGAAVVNSIWKESLLAKDFTFYSTVFSSKNMFALSQSIRIEYVDDDTSDYFIVAFKLKKNFLGSLLTDPFEKLLRSTQIDTEANPVSFEIKDEL